MKGILTMKKLLLFVLTAAMVLTLVIPAFAEDDFVSPVAGAGTQVAEHWIVEMPVDCTATFLKEADKLTAEQQNTFTAAENSLRSPDMANFSVHYLFYYIPTEEAKHPVNPEDAYILVNTVQNERCTAMQYLNGTWVILDTKYDPAETILTIKNANQEGPIVLGGRVTSSPSAPVVSSKKTSYLPLLVDAPEGSKAVSILDAADELSKEAQKTFADSQKTIRKDAPAGMAAQYFFYMSSDAAPSAVSMKIIDIDEVVVKQYKDGQWVELESQLNDDIATVQNLGDGPVVVFTK